ncbi:DUF4381 domain-containing protein [Pseudomonas sp. M30-35]|uniref:DUF4381 domain-containing protein n=1 Tax=Pseudomonas sp. M30-35 TaxID=1981174 RepID=UPI000B3C9C23|nr:DUF4381 domain-containing protein [Pseudomonas sp. M30-35]ARU87604.1 alpha-2 type XI collagen [Pseudomonas sp. M30-35]
MNRTDAPNISQLKELELTAPAFSYFPQTWGWLALLLVTLIILTVWAVLRWRHWQRNQYRRDALLRLAQLQDAVMHEHQRLPALRELPELLKRVALSMPNSPDVATLSGARWQSFLQDASATHLPADFSQQLSLLAYGPQAQLATLSQEQLDVLFSTCKQWIEAHHVAA